MKSTNSSKKRRLLPFRADSASGAVAAVQEAARAVALPPEAANLPPPVRVALDEILRMRAPSEWSGPDVRLAMALARDLDLIERHGAGLAVESELVRGRPNPRFKLIDAAHARVLRTMRSLQIHGRARFGESARIGQLRQPILDAAARLVDSDDDDLLARPVDGV
jgi:hypothetical protein